MRDWLQERQKPFIIVATKADKLSSNQLRANLQRTSATMGKDNEIVAYSAVTRRGADRIWKEITKRVTEHGTSHAG
jgi:GTP-binding protein EngB required for normal cell division